jgi:molybdopterin-guanine dinucleotide biosynthesis protein A
MPAPRADQITGLVLAGGAGRRMGGLDKGLQSFRGQPLARHAALCLQPQVEQVMISANRHLDAYRSWGWPVIADATATLDGPLAGILAGLSACTTPWLACVPCDVPLLPTDWVSRLATQAAQNQAELAYACAAEGTQGEEPSQLRDHPTCCLIHTRLRPHLAEYLGQGGRKLQTWMQAQAHVRVPFEEALAFRNLNTLRELQDAQRE